MKNQQRDINPLSLLSLALVATMIVMSGCGGEAVEEPAAGDSPKVNEPDAEPAAAVAAAGVNGRVVFDGPRPERSVIPTDPDPKCAILHGGEELLSELKVVSEDGGVQHAFVYVKNAPEGDYPVPSEPAVLDQVGCMYTPHILGFRAGQMFNVKNSDETIHNIRSYSKTNKPFNISQPTPGIREWDEPKLPKAEMGVKMKCDFHPWMTAYVFAMDHPFYAVTDENGAFTISDLPDGEYTLGVWHEVWGEQEATITVADGSAEAAFTYSE